MGRSGLDAAILASCSEQPSVTFDPVDVDLAFFGDGNGDRVFFLGQRSGGGFGELHVDALGHHRRGDHKDDQQNQHDIDQGGDIDLRHQPATAVSIAAHCAHRG